ncbi:hypothetical protein TPA0905_57440 [Streptomyces olivaceus]|nr:hypothetical protein TPA0905_57440 [Streptomyces olivaceus]
MKDQFWPLAECWDGWRGVRIGSPVVVIWQVQLPRDDAGPLRFGAKAGAGYMMDWFSVNGTIRSNMRTPRGCGGGTASGGESCGDRSAQIDVRRSAGVEGASSPAPRMRGELLCRQRLRLMPGDYALETSQ